MVFTTLPMQIEGKFKLLIKLNYPTTQSSLILQWYSPTWKLLLPQSLLTFLLRGRSQNFLKRGSQCVKQRILPSFCYLNIVGCLLKKGSQKGGHRHLGPLPLPQLCSCLIIKVIFLFSYFTFFFITFCLIIEIYFAEISVIK